MTEEKKIKAPAGTRAMCYGHKKEYLLMSKSIVPQNSPEQLPLIPEDQKPRGVVIDGVAYISLYDAYRIYGNSSNPSRDWTRDKAQLKKQGYDVPKLVVWQFDAKNGGKPTPVVNEEQVARIAQVALFPEWEPVRQLMAQLLVAYQHEKVKHNQAVTKYQLSGKSEDWAKSRVEAKEATKEQNAAIYNAHETHSPDFGRIAGEQNHALFEMSVQEIVDYLGLLPNQKKEYRDHLSRWATEAIRLSSKEIAYQIRQLNRPLTDSEIVAIVGRISREVVEHAKALAALDRVDFISGAPLDENGKALIVRNVKLLKGGQR